MIHRIGIAFVIFFSIFANTNFVLAQTYPVKPIRIIVPFPPGAPNDIIARLIGPKLTERMGQSVIIENRPGASGQIGLQQLKNAAPDGYTLGIAQSGTLSLAPHTYKTLPYDPLKDFAPVALNVTNYSAVIVGAGAAFRNPAEMIAWAKANPGKLSVGTNGEGGYSHLAFEYLAKMAGITFTHVPFKGDAQVLIDVMGGQVQVGIGAYTSFVPQLESGRVQLIAVTNPVRVPNKPELPIFSDTVHGYDMRGWFGVIAPAGTPREIIVRLNQEINRAINAPDVTEKLVAGGLIIVTESPAFFGDLINKYHDKFGKLTRDIGFRPQ